MDMYKPYRCYLKSSKLGRKRAHGYTSGPVCKGKTQEKSNKWKLLCILPLTLCLYLGVCELQIMASSFISTIFHQIDLKFYLVRHYIQDRRFDLTLDFAFFWAVTISFFALNLADICTQHPKPIHHPIGYPMVGSKNFCQSQLVRQ